MQVLSENSLVIPRGNCFLSYVRKFMFSWIPNHKKSQSRNYEKVYRMAVLWQSKAGGLPVRKKYYDFTERIKSWQSTWKWEVMEKEENMKSKAAVPYPPPDGWHVTADVISQARNRIFMNSSARRSAENSVCFWWADVFHQRPIKSRVKSNPKPKVKNQSLFSRDDTWILDKVFQICAAKVWRKA